jgi:hypothetical protein
MKTYLVKEYGGCMDGDTSYKIVKGDKLKYLNNFGDFIAVYELKQSKRLSKEKLKALGVSFIN